MGQDKTVSSIKPGQFNELMTWLVYSEVKKPSGAIEKTWTDGASFLSNVLEDAQISDDEKYQDVKRRKLVFVSWNYPNRVASRVKYNGIIYTVDSIRLLKRGLYVEYTCTTGNGN